MEPTTPSAVPSYVAAIIRTLLGVLGGWLIGKGYVTADQLPELGGILLGAATLIWSIAHKVNVAKAFKDAQDAAKAYQKGPVQ